MAGKIFISYRRNDAAGDARSICDGLAKKFGKSNVFMDVDKLLAGQRFDQELTKALDDCDVLIAVIGSRWMDLLSDKTTSGERDYVPEEIAAALRRGIVVIPVRVGHEGRMPALPRRDDLPEAIRDLVLHQKHDVAHERFGRDIADLIAAIRIARRSKRTPRPRWPVAAAITAALLLTGWIALYRMPMPEWVRGTSDPAEVKVDGAVEAEAQRKAEEAERQRLAEEDRKAKAAAEAEAKRKAAEAERQRLADEDRKAKAVAEAEARRKAEEAERQRLADEGRKAKAAVEKEANSDGDWNLAARPKPGSCGFPVTMSVSVSNGAITGMGVTGSVDRSGRVRAKWLLVNATGQFLSPGSGSGIWRDSLGCNGIWTATRQ